MGVWACKSSGDMIESHGAIVFDSAIRIIIGRKLTIMVKREDYRSNKKGNFKRGGHKFSAERI